jgi:hypothetical protein
LCRPAADYSAVAGARVAYRTARTHACPARADGSADPDASTAAHAGATLADGRGAIPHTSALADTGASLRNSRGAIPHTSALADTGATSYTIAASCESAAF